MNKIAHSPWLVRSTPNSAYTTLYCFPFAGGSAAAFRDWQDALGPMVDVCAIQLPGRGMRMLETPLGEIDVVVKGIADAIMAEARGQFAFFGHSLGSLVAFETTRELRRRGASLPVHLFVSGKNAPGKETEKRKLHLLSDADLIEQLRDYNGTPPEILEHKELMALLLPTIRADFQLVDTYSYHAEPRLPIPMSMLQGRADPFVDPETCGAWGDQTSREFAEYWFEGDHFYIMPERDAVIDIVRKTLLPDSILSEQKVA